MKNLIWKANVPPKVRIFGWRIATDSLPTNINKRRRTLEINDTCSICGNGEEDAFHATVICTKATALRQAMRKVWTLPPESSFSFTGHGWLQHLLGQTDEKTRDRTLML